MTACRPFVGRDAEVAAVVEYLAAGPAVSTALSIVGESGIGKTTVWEEAVRLACDRAFFVLAARPAESEARLSFAGLADLLVALPPEVVARLPGPQRDAVDVALRASRRRGGPERRLLGPAFGSVLWELGSEGDLAFQ